MGHEANAEEDERCQQEDGDQAPHGLRRVIAETFLRGALLATVAALPRRSQPQDVQNAAGVAKTEQDLCVGRTGGVIARASPGGFGHHHRRQVVAHIRQYRAVEIATIVPVLALSHQTGVTLAEVGFLLILIAGVWLVAAQIPALKMRTARMIVAGIALALAGVLLIIATHWGHFG